MKTIQICGIIGWDCIPSEIRDALKAANGEDVLFEVSSPGGFIAPGLEIFNLIRNYTGKTIAKLSGYAMSMASYIPLACDEIQAEDNAVYMIHNARGGSWGDHNDVLKYGQYLKGLSGVIARAYVKRTGKSLEEIAAWMDAETYFFGQEMVDAGFVDLLLETEEDTGEENRLDMVASARACFEDAFMKLSKEPAQGKEDIQRAAALLEETQPPAPAGTNQREVEPMASLKELLAKDPAAQAEYDANISAAKAAGETAGKAAIAATIDKVAPFLKSGKYPGKIQETAIAVLKGDEPMGTLSASVAAVDAVREEARDKAAAAENGQETPAGQDPPHDPEKMVSTQDDLDAEVARLTGNGGK